MLKTILSISGKPGLYKLISQGKNMLIVESLIDKKRTPVYGKEKVISLGDIAMYTDTDDIPLAGHDALTDTIKDLALDLGGSLVVSAYGFVRHESLKKNIIER